MANERFNHVLGKLRNLIARPKTQADIDAARLRALRSQGVRVGEGCRIYSDIASTEPWLIEIGDRVGIAGGVKFLTHDGAAMMVRDRRPGAQKLGTIRIGDEAFIGENAILLPGTEIGSRCIVGPGAVVRGKVADNTLVFGNPAREMGRASLYLERLLLAPDTLDTYGLPLAERRALQRAHFGLHDGVVC
jgi:acetyltransferase-like isoleucine patch superfamily enzyme